MWGETMPSAVRLEAVTRRLTRDEQREQNRGRIIDAAEQVFLEVGFNAAAIEDIAERAGFTKGAFYSNFPNKAEVFYAVLERSIDAPAREVEARISADDPMAEQVAQAGSEFGSVFLADPAWSLLLMEFSLHAARNEDLRERYAERNRRVRRQIVELLQQHLTAAGLKLTVDPDAIATILFAFGSGVIIDRVVDPEAISDDVFGAGIGLLLQSATAPLDGPDRRQM